MILGFGVTSGFGVIGNFSITKRNFDVTDFPDSFYDIPDSFTGAGQTLRIAAQPGTRRSLYRFSLTEPYLFDTRNSLTVSASALTPVGTVRTLSFTVAKMYPASLYLATSASLSWRRKDALNSAFARVRRAGAAVVRWCWVSALRPEKRTSTTCGLARMRY